MAQQLLLLAYLIIVRFITFLLDLTKMILAAILTIFYLRIHEQTQPRSQTIRFDDMHPCINTQNTHKL